MKDYEDMTEEERRAARHALFDYMTLLQRENEFQEDDNEQSRAD